MASRANYHVDQHAQEAAHDVPPRQPTLAIKKLNVDRYQSEPDQRDFDMCGRFAILPGSRRIDSASAIQPD